LEICVGRERYLGNLEERRVILKWITSRHAGFMTTSNEGERMPCIRNGILRRTNLIFLAFMFLGMTVAQAQDSLVDLQKRKTIAEAENEAIEAETARDEARKKQSELVAPLDPVEAANSAEAITDDKQAQPDAQSLCTQCIQAAQEEAKKCLDSAISQEDKKSCLEKQETRTKTCSNGECKIERAQGGSSGSKGEVPSEKK
jgi:hypothetical protein